MAKHNETGTQAEILAEQHLVSQSLTPLARNYHCKGGEIDLIMQQQRALVFVEVRFRKSAAFGSAAASVTRSKQQKIITAAQHFLIDNSKLANLPCRFDVVAITAGQIEWIENAFTLNE